jgi:hypothetical protein
MNVDIEILKVLVTPLLKKGPAVFIAEGCGRIYVALVPSTKCRKCDGVHENHKVTDLEDLAALYS